MALVGSHGGVEEQRWAILGIFVTLIPVALLRGWTAMAVVTATANIALVTMMPKINDIDTLNAQGWMVAYMTGLFYLAAKTSTAERLIREEAEALRHARRTYLLTERLRFASFCHLDEALDNTRAATTQLLHRTRKHVSSIALSEHKQQFEELFDRCERILAGWSPCDWWDVGDPDALLLSALRAEGIGLDILDMPPQPQQLGLTLEMNITIKQLVCEAVLHVLECAPSNRVSVAIGVTPHNDDKGHAIEIAVESTGLPNRLDDEAYERLMIGVGGLGLNEIGLRDRASLYDGTVQISSSPGQPARVVIRLIDQPEYMIF
jgi:hypothetical protein